MAELELVLETISGYVWGVPLLILLFGTHLFLTARLGLIQRRIPHAIRLSLTRSKEGEGEISHFGALVTSLAATIGTGNIIGVATAIAAGGPGAVFWMWLTGVFGIATKYAESLLSVHFRTIDGEGRVAGGPMYVLERGLKLKWLGVVFAALTAIAAFGIGNMVQANSISDLLLKNFAFPTWATGLLLAALTAVVILGGIKSIARVCQVLVPVMAIVYVTGCLVLLFLHAETIPDSLSLIFNGAFNGQAAIGGFLGVGMREAVRFGIARGLFSNESGLGSAPIVAAAAQTKDPVRQALVSATGTFWDTVVVCAITGLVIVNSGAWTQGIKGPALVSAAFGAAHSLGPPVVTFGLLTFVFSTILGWSYYGEKAIEYLFGTKAIFPYRIVWILAVLAGAVASLGVVWNFADIANGLMAVPNLYSLLALSPLLAAETRRYFGRRAGA
jgi:AGCS family alanine or glycine:cation symporter